MVPRGTCVVDLFAGAGGLSIGAYQAGARVGASVELNPYACQTLRANPKYHGEVIEADVCDLSGQDLRRAAKVKRGEPLVVVGGPPCQAFSKAAYWTESGEEAAYRRARAQGVEADRPVLAERAPDARRDLVYQFWRLVSESKADGFVFENVPSIKHPRNRAIYDQFIQKARNAGYLLTELKVNAAQFGVAQSRERVIVMGSSAPCRLRLRQCIPLTTRLPDCSCVHPSRLVRLWTVSMARSFLNRKRWLVGDGLSI